MAKKNISELSSDELYRLAQEREQQEAAKLAVVLALCLNSGAAK